MQCYPPAYHTELMGTIAMHVHCSLSTENGKLYGVFVLYSATANYDEFYIKLCSGVLVLQCHFIHPLHYLFMA